MAAMAINSQGSMQRATKWDHLEDLEMGIWVIFFEKLSFFLVVGYTQKCKIHRGFACLLVTGMKEFIGDGCNGYIEENISYIVYWPFIWLKDDPIESVAQMQAQSRSWASLQIVVVRMLSLSHCRNPWRWQRLFSVEVFRGSNFTPTVNIQLKEDPFKIWLLWIWLWLGNHKKEASVDWRVWICLRYLEVNLNFYGKSPFGEYVLCFPNISQHQGYPERSCRWCNPHNLLVTPETSLRNIPWLCWMMGWFWHFSIGSFRWLQNFLNIKGLSICTLKRPTAWGIGRWEEFSTLSGAHRQSAGMERSYSARALAQTVLILFDR